MLSLGGARQEGAGSRGGASVADDAEELEEGEACPDADGEGFFDPDVALAYIDEKLQHVLGHFQKDFEGGVCVENLGSKFGGYGSFLPTHQHSPLLSQSRSPHIAANISTSRSPYQPSAERIDQKPMVAVKSISLNNGPGAPSTSDLLNKEICSSTNDEESVAGSDSLDSSFNGNYSKSFKVQTKVCPNNDLLGKNAAIYSGLGLDISSSSSMEESPDGLGGLSPEFSNMPCESPRTILKVMTCFPVPGGFLLSPLHGNLLQLTNKVAPMLKKWETRLDMENVPRASEGRSKSSLPPGPVRGHVDKQMKPSSQKMMSVDKKTRKDKGDTSVIVNKEVNIEMPTSQEIISDMPAPTTEVKSESQFAQETKRNACISRPSQRNDDVQLKEQIGCNYLATVETEVIQATTSYTGNSSFEKSRTGILAPQGGPKIKMSKVDIDLEERDMYHHKSSSFDRKEKSKVKAERKFEAAIVDCEYNESRNKEWGVQPCDYLRNVPLEKIYSSNRTGDDNPRNEIKRMNKESHLSAVASYDLMEDDNCIHSSAADTDREHATELKSRHFEKKAKYHKDIEESLPNRCHGDMEEGLLEGRSAQGELHQKEKIMNTNSENEFDVGSARKEILISVKHKKLCMLSNSGVATMNPDPVHAPAVIEEHWVCCDICQKWRLLPYGTNPTMLPNKWKCNMLYWIPGMNRCDISEDETTDALNALYAIPAPATTVSSGGPHTAGANTATSSAYNINGQFEQSRKRKNAPSGRNGLAESSYHTPLSTPLMSDQQDPIINIRSTDDVHYSFETDSASKHGLRPVSKSADLLSEKQKYKHKNHSSYSDGAGIMEGNKANSKIKNKSGIHQEQEAYKKTKIEDQCQIGRDRTAGELNFHCSLQGISDGNNKEISQLACSQVSGTTCPERSLENSPPEASWRKESKDLTANDTGLGRQDRQLCSGDKKGLDMEGPSPQPGQHLFDRRTRTLDSESGPITHESKDIEICQGSGSGTVQWLGVSFKKEKSHLRIDNQNIRNPVAQVVTLPMKEGKQKICPNSEKSDLLKMKPKLMRSNFENGVQLGTVKQEISNPLDTSPMRKDGSIVAFALKEARDLKHKANELKSKGQELESTGLYFEAALKFLHVAFLLETPSFDSSKPGDVAQSMKMYSETAKLCNFCAYEYERFKKMAAAALAYKCVEVAYLKAAYYKHPSASKDRQGLQAAVQIAPGIDNLNSHGLSKASSTKGRNSSQVPGNHLPLAVHNQAHLLRLLAYTNDVNLAFNATRKSELVIASVTGSRERGEGVDDGLASVKTVLDLNFSNVNELLRLVRVSMESIRS